MLNVACLEYTRHSIDVNEDLILDLKTVSQCFIMNENGKGKTVSKKCYLLIYILRYVLRF